MEEIIQSFIKDKMFNASDIAGQCHFVSTCFINHCKKHQIKAALVFLMDYIGEPFPDLHSLYADEDFLIHHVVAIGSQTYDFTHRQFNVSSPVPLLQTVDELKNLWETVDVNTQGWFIPYSKRLVQEKAKRIMHDQERA